MLPRGWLQVPAGSDQASFKHEYNKWVSIRSILMSWAEYEARRRRETSSASEQSSHGGPGAQVVDQLGEEMGVPTGTLSSHLDGSPYLRRVRDGQSGVPGEAGQPPGRSCKERTLAPAPRDRPRNSNGLSKSYPMAHKCTVITPLPTGVAGLTVPSPWGAPGMPVLAGQVLVLDDATFARYPSSFSRAPNSFGKALFVDNGEIGTSAQLSVSEPTYTLCRDDSGVGHRHVVSEGNYQEDGDQSGGLPEHLGHRPGGRFHQQPLLVAPPSASPRQSEPTASRQHLCRGHFQRYHCGFG